MRRLPQGFLVKLQGASRVAAGLVDEAEPGERGRFAHLDWATHILVMGQRNISRLKERFPRFLLDSRLSSLAQYVEGAPQEILDPYGQSPDVFRETFRQIRSACQRFLSSVREEAGE